MIAALYRESNCPEHACDALIESVQDIDTTETLAPLLAAANLAVRGQSRIEIKIS
jgi:hypothetical protein